LDSDRGTAAENVEGAGHLDDPERDGRELFVDTINSALNLDDQKRGPDSKRTLLIHLKRISCLHHYSTEDQ